ncbi:hypothetical protein M3Y99_01896400 [Aphelenchoides fujianensis]|nr:hypothetical protein M3Y99_01896400 [Aphelenchoides fujianensis]
MTTTTRSSTRPTSTKAQILNQLNAWCQQKGGILLDAQRNALQHQTERILAVNNAIQNSAMSQQAKNFAQQNADTIYNMGTSWPQTCQTNNQLINQQPQAVIDEVNRNTNVRTQIQMFINTQCMGYSEAQNAQQSYQVCGDNPNGSGQQNGDGDQQTGHWGSSGGSTKWRRFVGQRGPERRFVGKWRPAELGRIVGQRQSERKLKCCGPSPFGPLTTTGIKGNNPLTTTAAASRTRADRGATTAIQGQQPPYNNGGGQQNSGGSWGNNGNYPGGQNGNQGQGAGTWNGNGGYQNGQNGQQPPYNQGGQTGGSWQNGNGQYPNNQNGNYPSNGQGGNNQGSYPPYNNGNSGGYYGGNQEWKSVQQWCGRLPEQQSKRAVPERWLQSRRKLQPWTERWIAV